VTASAIETNLESGESLRKIHALRLSTTRQMPNTITAPTIEAMIPAPWPGPYRWIARPRKVATTPPTIPSTVVRRKPCGLLGDGDSYLAMKPATAPTIMAQMICMANLA
jgi:hypothetical protein